MATIKIYNQDKKESGEITLSSDVFEVEVRPEILNLVVRAQMAAKRAGTHNAKTRAYVSGGGVKPWKQKGTGRARAGSNRSPIWRGGAIIFGPSPRDYSFKVNSKVRALALKMALSSRYANNNLLVVDNINLPEAKTKHFAKVVSALGLSKALVILPNDDDNLQRSARNISGITLMTPSSLNVLDVLRHKQLVILEKAIAPVVERFAKKGA